MLEMELAYRRRSRGGGNNQDESSLAPPSYSRLAEQKDSELPSYSATDPYALLNPPTYEGEEPAADTATTPAPADTQTSSLEDAPLLSNDES
jgi:hypothetical protein